MDETPDPIAPRSDLRALAAIVVAGLVLRVAALGGADLWTDEIQTLKAVRLPWDELAEQRLLCGHVPVYFAALKAWCSVFGTSQFALRLPSALAGTALLLPAWALLRRLAGPRAGAWGTAFLAASPLFVELSREARMYPLLALWFVVAAHGAVRSIDGLSPGWPFWAVVVLGPLTSTTWAFGVVPLAAWVVLERRTEPGSARATLPVLAGLAASLLLLAALLPFVRAQEQILSRRPWPAESAVFGARLLIGTRFISVDPRLAAATTLVLAVLPAVGAVLAPPRVRRFALFVTVGVCGLSVLVGVLGGVPWGPARYVSLAVFGIAAAAGVGAARAKTCATTWAGAIAVAILAAVSLLALVARSNEWKAAADQLRAEREPVVVDDTYQQLVLAYYLGRDVSLREPPPGTTAWWHASLVIDGAFRRVEITRVVR